MICGRWLSLCHECGENSISLAEHILLFCPSNHNFRNVLWQKLIARFGFAFYITFISLSATEQVNSMLSGFGTLLDHERDRVDSVKIFLSTLNSTANIKAVRGSLWSISVNKLSHIPKLQLVSVVYKNNDARFDSVYLSSYLPLNYPTHFLHKRSGYCA